MKAKTKTTWKLFSWPVCVALLASLTGCNSNEPSQSSSQTKVNSEPLTSLSPAQQAQKKLAIDAKDKLFASLLGELTKSMADQGPAKSIAVCKTRAPEIAETISKETGVRIGRTSFKLRNDANSAPLWAARFVSERVEKPLDVALPNDGLGVLLPIRLQATCAFCHGADDQIRPEVKAAIVANYPNDTATGFSEGDIRGYFWVEVPADAQSQ